MWNFLQMTAPVKDELRCISIYFKLERFISMHTHPVNFNFQISIGFFCYTPMCLCGKTKTKQMLEMDDNENNTSQFLHVPLAGFVHFLPTAAWWRQGSIPHKTDHDTITLPKQHGSRPLPSITAKQHKVDIPGVALSQVGHRGMEDGLVLHHLHHTLGV